MISVVLCIGLTTVDVLWIVKSNNSCDLATDSNRDFRLLVYKYRTSYVSERSTCNSITSLIDL